MKFSLIIPLLVAGEPTLYLLDSHEEVVGQEVFTMLDELTEAAKELTNTQVRRFAVPLIEHRPFYVRGPWADEQTITPHAESISTASFHVAEAFDPLKHWIFDNFIYPWSNYTTDINDDMSARLENLSARQPLLRCGQPHQVLRSEFVQFTGPKDIATLWTKQQSSPVDKMLETGMPLVKLLQAPIEAVTAPIDAMIDILLPKES